MITKYNRRLDRIEIFKNLSLYHDKYNEKIYQLLTVVLEHQILDLYVTFTINNTTKYTHFNFSCPGVRIPINPLYVLYYRGTSLSVKEKIINDLKKVFEGLFGIKVNIFDEYHSETSRGDVSTWTVEFSKTPRYLDYKLPLTGMIDNSLHEDQITISSETKDFKIPISVIETRTDGIIKKLIRPERFSAGDYINLRQYPEEAVQIFIDFLTIGTIGMLNKYKDKVELILDADLFTLAHYLEEPSFTNTLMAILQDFMIETYSDDPSSDDARDFRAQLRQYKEYVPVIPMINHFIKQFMPLAKYIDQNYGYTDKYLDEKGPVKLYNLKIDVEHKKVKIDRTLIENEVSEDLYRELMKIGYHGIEKR